MYLGGGKHVIDVKSNDLQILLYQHEASFGSRVSQANKKRIYELPFIENAESGIYNSLTAL
jgi:hypothetical protein